MAYAFKATYSAGYVSAVAQVSIGITCALNDRLVVECTYGAGSTDNAVSVSDNSGSNVYSAVLKSLPNGTIGQTHALYECKSTIAGTPSVTFHSPDSNNSLGIWVSVYSGLDNTVAGVVNGQIQANPGTGTDSVSGLSVTPGSQPGAVIGLSTDDSGVAVFAHGTGFTSRGAGYGGTGSLIEDERVTSLTSVAATFTAGTDGSGNEFTFTLFVPESGGAVAAGFNHDSEVCWIDGN